MPTLDDLYPVPNRPLSAQSPGRAPVSGGRSLEDLYPTKTASGSFDLSYLDVLEKEFGLTKPPEQAPAPLGGDWSMIDDMPTSAAGMVTNLRSPRWMREKARQYAEGITDPSEAGKHPAVEAILRGITSGMGQVAGLPNLGKQISEPALRGFAGGAAEGLAEIPSGANALMLGIGGMQGIAAKAGWPALSAILGGANLAAGLPFLAEGASGIAKDPANPLPYLQTAMAGIATKLGLNMVPKGPGGRIWPFPRKGASAGAVETLTPSKFQPDPGAMPLEQGGGARWRPGGRQGTPLRDALTLDELYPNGPEPLTPGQAPQQGAMP
ncbi:MAG TPA: hypothetical protein VM431_04125, partial [Phycisphaerae bacterium]|nr:hypothetical protein [Phycisphaerae bacterium]